MIYLSGCWREHKNHPQVSGLFDKQGIMLFTGKLPHYNGDYISLDPITLQRDYRLVIEVKHSPQDLHSSIVGQRWENFKRQGREMGKYKDRILICIFGPQEVLRWPQKGREMGLPIKITGSFIMRRFMSWCHYNNILPIWSTRPEEFARIINYVLGDNQ